MGLYILYWVVVRLPWPGVVKKAANTAVSPFRLFITLEETEAYAYSQDKPTAGANEIYDEQQEGKMSVPMGYGRKVDTDDMQLN